MPRLNERDSLGTQQRLVNIIVLVKTITVTTNIPSAISRTGLSSYIDIPVSISDLDPWHWKKEWKYVQFPHRGANSTERASGSGIAAALAKPMIAPRRRRLRYLMMTWKGSFSVRVYGYLGNLRIKQKLEIEIESDGIAGLEQSNILPGGYPFSSIYIIFQGHLAQFCRLHSLQSRSTFIGGEEGSHSSSCTPYQEMICTKCRGQKWFCFCRPKLLKSIVLVLTRVHFICEQLSCCSSMAPSHIAFPTWVLIPGWEGRSLVTRRLATM